MEIILIYPTPEGSQETVLEGSRFSFGRGSDADFRFDDDGLSRLNSTIYREGSRVWIVDEGSTNGTFVNGEGVSGSGTPLEDGDTIKIGNYTSLRIKFSQKQSVTASSSHSSKNSKTATTVSSSEKTRNPATLIAAGAIAVAFFLISISVVFVAVKTLSKDEPVIVQNNPNNFDGNDDEEITNSSNNNKDSKDSNEEIKPTVTPKTENNSTPVPDKDEPQSSDTRTDNNPQTPPIPSGKKYLELSDAEKNKYIESRLKKIAGIIGNRASEEIPIMAINRIKTDVTGYANRIRSAKKPGTGCYLGDNLQTTYERASKNTWFISRSYMQEGIDPIVGIYVAMIESEHCPCVQSGTGPLGMFQFAYAAATENFDKTDNIVRGAKPPNGDDRCNPEKAARASARYVKYLMGWYGTGPASVPLAVASYNSGQGAFRSNLRKALISDPSLSRDFWTLIANADKLDQQFQTENFKYPPKFFAAAIVGEHPRDFGLNLSPLSTYTSK